MFAREASGNILKKNYATNALLRNEVKKKLVFCIRDIVMEKFY